MVALEVCESGPSVLVQDLGRPGLAHLGVGPSGAADRSAFGLANRLVGNSEQAATLEILMGGFAARALGGDVLVATAGAPAPMSVDATTVAPHSVITLHRGQLLRIATPSSGLRTYLAVRGGVDVPLVLGSRSTDALAGLGPEPVGVGDVLPVGDEAEGYPLVEVAPVPAATAEVVELRVVPGPHQRLLSDESVMYSLCWAASSDSDRTAVRLDGEPLVLDGAGSRPSEGLVRGAIQVPPSGQPIVFLADHPVTGGYPVVGVVVDDDVDRAAQARPGQPIRLTRVVSRRGPGSRGGVMSFG